VTGYMPAVFFVKSYYYVDRNLDGQILSLQMWCSYTLPLPSWKAGTHGWLIDVLCATAANQCRKLNQDVTAPRTWQATSIMSPILPQSHVAIS